MTNKGMIAPSESYNAPRSREVKLGRIHPQKGKKDPGQRPPITPILEMCFGSVSLHRFWVIISDDHKNARLPAFRDKCLSFQVDVVSCDLLRDRDLLKLCDGMHGRCTWHLVIQMSDYYLSKQLGDSHKLLFTRPGITTSTVVVPDIVLDHVDRHRQPVRFDWGVVLDKLRAYEWGGSSYPEDWSKFVR